MLFLAEIGSRFRFFVLIDNLWFKKISFFLLLSFFPLLISFITLIVFLIGYKKGLLLVLFGGLREIFRDYKFLKELSTFKLFIWFFSIIAESFIAPTLDKLLKEFRFNGRSK